MPLEILLPLVVMGIAGIAFTLHFLGLTDGPGLSSDDAARKAWAREFPDAPATNVARSITGRAALVETGDRLGIVWRFGADTTARDLEGAEAQVQNDTLILLLPDYGARRIKLHLAPGEAEAWAETIGQKT
ncbi:hypothetical protein [Roseovarius sp. E0-M6]|uniref:hypothetical protein n=1 Tax=Roseovarius sp. E0-M6 TaxID=3127118 RepID=UPI00300F839F